MSTQEARGAADTFEEFVNATAGRLLRTAVFLVYDRHLAEDLLQVAYERVARRWRRLADGDPEAYARRVLVNLAIDEGKRRRRRRDTPAGAAADLDRIAGRAPHDVPSGDGELEEALRALPAQQRAVVVLRYWCDLGEREIADTLGISRGTVKSHTARAMAALREHVREGRTHGR